MSEISKLNNYDLKDKTARANHDALVEEVNGFVDEVNTALGEIDDKIAALPSEAPDPTDYYWANVKVSASSNANTTPTFNPAFKVNLTTNLALSPSQDGSNAYASPIPKYLWHDLLGFGVNGTPTVEYSTDGSTWTASTDTNFTKKLFINREDQGVTTINDSRPYMRWTWGKQTQFHVCKASWLIIGFAYTSSAATNTVTIENSGDGTTWTTLATTSLKGNQAPYWFKLADNWSSKYYFRITFQRTSAAGTSTSLSGIKLLTGRWGNQGRGSEYEYPYAWDEEANIFYRSSTSTLGTEEKPWAEIHGKELYASKISLAGVNINETFVSLDTDQQIAGVKQFLYGLGVQDETSEYEGEGVVVYGGTYNTVYGSETIKQGSYTYTFPKETGTFALGASSSTDNAIARYDGTTGKIVQDSKVTIADTGSITIGGTWTGTSANNPYLSMGGYAKLTANSSGAFTFAPSGTPTFLATTTEFRPISDTADKVDLGSSSYKFRTVYATTFNGNATSATNADNATKFDGKTVLLSTDNMDIVDANDDLIPTYAATANLIGMSLNDLGEEIYREYMPLSGGTFTGDVTMQATSNASSSNFTWGTVNSNTPYIGYASDQTDGTFIITSLKGTDYKTGLAIGGGSGNLFWKGVKLATVNDVSALVDSAPDTLNTLNELAAALGDDPNFATTVSTKIGNNTSAIETLQDEVSQKQATITGGASTITSSDLTANRALISNSSGKVAVSAVTSTELGYLDGVTSNVQTQIDGKLDKTTYEWNEEITFTGSDSGKALLIGKFPCYDTNLTVEIKSTTNTTYYGQLVIATQNIKVDNAGTIKANVYGDATNTLASALTVVRESISTRVVAIYFKPANYSKHLIHVQAVALSASPTDMLTKVDAVPTTDDGVYAVIKPTNQLTETFLGKRETAVEAILANYVSSYVAPSADEEMPVALMTATDYSSNEKGSPLYASGITYNPYTGALTAKSFVENGTSLSSKYLSKTDEAPQSIASTLTLPSLAIGNSSNGITFLTGTTTWTTIKKGSDTTANIDLLLPNKAGTFALTSDITDNKVMQEAIPSGVSGSFPILLAPSGQTATKTTTSCFSSGLTYNPHTGELSAASFLGNATYATKASSATNADNAAKFDGRTIKDSNASLNLADFNDDTVLTSLAVGYYVGSGLSDLADDVENTYLKKSGGTLTGELITDDLTIKGTEAFYTRYAKKMIGMLNKGTAYDSLDDTYKDGTYYRMWRLRFPANCRFWGKIKITLYGGYSSGNASGIMSKSITCNFNESTIYNNVGSYDGLGVYVEKDFRISEAIWNSTAGAWEILIWQKNLDWNNSPCVYLEGWFGSSDSASATYLANFNNITAQEVELTQDTTYTALKASSTGGTKTVTWADTPVYENPLGEGIVSASSAFTSGKVIVGDTSGTRTVKSSSFEISTLSLSNNSSTIVPTQSAVKTYTDGTFATKANNPNLAYYAADSGSTTEGTWIASCSDVTSLFDGLSVKYKVTVAGASTTTFNLNSLGAKTVYMRGTSKVTTHYAKGTMLQLTYNATTDAWYTTDYDANSNVTQTNTTTSAEYRLLFSYNASDTTETKGARKSTNFKVNPSTGALSAKSFVEDGVSLSGKYAQMSVGNIWGAPQTFSAGIQLNTISAPTSSGGTTYGTGSSGQVLKSNGTTVYWASDSNSDVYLRQYYTLTTANGEYPIIYSYTTNTGTSSYKSTYGAVKSGFTFNPSADTLSVGNLLLQEGASILTPNSLTISADNGSGDCEIKLDGYNLEAWISADTIYLYGDTYDRNGGFLMSKRKVTLAQLRSLWTAGMLVQLAQPSTSANLLHSFITCGSVVAVDHLGSSISETRTTISSTESTTEWYKYILDISDTAATITYNFYAINDDGTHTRTMTAETLTLTDSNCYFYILEQT